MSDSRYDNKDYIKPSDNDKGLDLGGRTFSVNKGQSFEEFCRKENINTDHFNIKHTSVRKCPPIVQVIQRLLKKRIGSNRAAWCYAVKYGALKLEKDKELMDKAHQLYEKLETGAEAGVSCIPTDLDFSFFGRSKQLEVYYDREDIGKLDKAFMVGETMSVGHAAVVALLEAAASSERWIPLELRRKARKYVEKAKERYLEIRVMKYDEDL